jgi:hypothetical protein
MRDYSRSQETDIFSVYIAASESFVECLWIHLGANIPAACSQADLCVQSVSSVPSLSLAIFAADLQQSVLVHCLHQHDVCPSRLWTVQHRAHPIQNSFHSNLCHRTTKYKQYYCTYRAWCKFSLWNQPYMRWNMNTVDAQYPTCFGTAWVPLSGNRHFFSTIISDAISWSWHSRSAETCRRLCFCCVSIAVYVCMYVCMYVLLLLLLLLLTAIELSLGGSSPYTSTVKINKNKYA